MQQASQSKRRSSGAFRGFLASSDASQAVAAAGLVERSPQLEQTGQAPGVVGHHVAETSAGTSDVLEVLREAKPQWSEGALFDAEAKLAQVGIWTVKELAEALRGRLNGRLRDAGLKAFKPETLRDLRRAANIRLRRPTGSKPAQNEPVVASAVWVDMEGDLPSAEGLLNQVDMEIDYDACWSQTFGPERGPDEASTAEQCGSCSDGSGGSEGCTREGLLNQLDIDEDYDADWCQSLSHVCEEDRPEVEEDKPDDLVEAAAGPKLGLGDYTAASDRTGGPSSNRGAPLARKVAVGHAASAELAAPPQARHEISALEGVEPQLSTKDASSESTSVAPAVDFDEWLALKEARRCAAVLDRGDQEVPRGYRVSFVAWLSGLEQQAGTSALPAHELTALLVEPLPALEDLPLQQTRGSGSAAPSRALAGSRALLASPAEPLFGLEDLPRSGHEGAVPAEPIPALDDLLRSIDLADAEQGGTLAEGGSLVEAGEPQEDIVELERKARDRLLQRFKDAEAAREADLD